MRGIAILLVVVGHVIGSDPSGGMQIDFPHPLRYIYVWIDYIQMPLFTAIAGWVYALKPFTASSGFKKFAMKKALRLLVPMAAVATLYFLVQYFIPGTNKKGELTEMWRIYVFPYTIYWYLPSLFLIFVAQWWLDKKGWMGNHLRRWVGCLLFALFLCYAERHIISWEVPNLFSFKGAFNQLPYFVLGVGVQRFGGLLYGRWLYVAYILGAAVGIVLLQLEWFFALGGVLWNELWQPVWVLATLMLLLRSKWQNRFLSWLGGYAYSIYLFHGFGTSGGRILLKWIGVKVMTPIFCTATLMATFFPIGVDWVCSRYRMLRVIFLGKR